MTARSGRGFVLLFTFVLGLLLATLAAAFVLPAPWSWLIGYTYLGWDSWLLLRLVLAARAAIAIPRPAASGPRPSLAVVIAGRDEATVLPATLAALLAQDEPAESILVVDDGSRDGSAAWLERTWVLAPGADWRTSAVVPALRVLVKANSGKADSLNRALAVSDADVLVTLDADTVPAPGALRALRDAFAADPTLVAAGGVLTPVCRGRWRGIFALYQRLEYLRSFLWRAAWMRDDCLVLVSGAFAAIRRAPLAALAGFDATSPVEDYELMFRLHRWSVTTTGRPLRAAVVAGARATTDAPAAVGAFLRQRRRWFAGFLATLIGNRDLVGNPRFARLGRVHLRLKTADMLLPLYGLAALAALALQLTRDGRVATTVLVVLAAKLVLDAACASWCALLARRWLGAGELGPGGALVAALSEPFAFQLLRQVGAVLGWVALLRGRIEWTPGRAAARTLAALALATAALAADPAQARALAQTGRLPEAEAEWAAVVAEHPDDTAALAGLATVRGWRGRHAAAIATWRAALALRPADAGLGLGLARALWWSGDSAAAEATIAPLLPRREDAETWILAGDIAASAGDQALARRRYVRAASIDPASAGPERLARTRPPRRWRADAGGWSERFPGARGTESGLYASLGLRLAPGWAVAVGSERQARATAVDWRHDLELYLRPQPRLDLYLRAAATPDNDFLPEREGELDTALRLGAPVDLLAGVRAREYPQRRLATWRPGVRLRPLTWVAVSIRADTTTGLGRHRDGGEARIELDLPHAVRPYLGLGFGEEVEPPAPPYRTRTVGGGVVLMLEPGFGLRLDAALEDREQLGVSERIGIGAIVAF